MTTQQGVCIAAALGLLALYFRLGLPWLDRLSQHLAKTLPVWRDRDWIARSDMMHLAVAVFGQSLLWVLLLQLAPAYHVALRLSVSGLVFGALLGIGEMAASALLVNITLTALSYLLSDRAPASIAAWVPYSRGGWMRYFSSVNRNAHWLLKLGLCLGYISVEEWVYRATLVEIFRPLGGLAAVGLSIVGFIVAQIVWTPTWRTWIFPAIGAAVVGPIHGYLYFRQGDMFTLIVAHLSFFFASTWQSDTSTAPSSQALQQRG